LLLKSGQRGELPVSKSKLALILTSALATVVAPAIAAAQTSPPAPDAQTATQVEDVVVTAQRRAENLQDVPVAVTAFTGAALQDQGTVRVDDIASRVPNLFIASGNSIGTTRLNLRGVFSEPNNVGLGNAIPNYMDGVAAGPGRTLNTGLYDVEAIEVLRGPQGTLFGRNSTGGAILVRSNQPSTERTSGAFNVGWGDYENARIGGAYNVPLSDNAAVRFAAAYQNRNGFTRNTTLNIDQNDLESLALRVQGLFEPSENLSITLRFDGATDTQAANVKDFGPNASGGRLFAGARDFKVSTDFPSLTERDMYTVSGEISYDFGGGYRLVSLSAYSWFDYLNRDDVDYTSSNVLNTSAAVQQDQISQEFRIESPSDGQLSWVAGLYLYREETTTQNAAAGSLLTLVRAAPDANTWLTIGTGGRETTAIAPFGQVTFRANDWLSLVGGLRYTNEESDSQKFQPTGLAGLGIPAINATATTEDGEWSGTAKVVVEPTDALMAYASFSRGFKASGFNLAPGGPSDYTADPEFVDSYEVGFRSEWFDRRLRFNLTGFFLEYTDLQRSTFTIPPGSVIPQVIFGNAGALESKGLELELEARPTPELTVGGTLGLLDAEFTDYIELVGTTQVSRAGNTPARTPDTTASAYFQYVYSGMSDLDISFRGDYLYRTETFETDSNVTTRILDEVSLANFRVSLMDKDDRWRLSGYVNNATDEVYAENVVPASGTVAGVGLSLGAPRTYGVEFSRNF
jgi:iron complex outermembrane receptor protein